MLTFKDANKKFNQTLQKASKLNKKTFYLMIAVILINFPYSYVIIGNTFGAALPVPHYEKTFGVQVWQISSFILDFLVVVCGVKCYLNLIKLGKLKKSLDALKSENLDLLFHNELTKNHS